MYSITREATFEYAHRLLNHPGKCRFIHGHSGKAIVTIRSESLNNNSMVMDFSELKSHMNEILEKWDHAILLQKGDPLITVLEALGQRITILSGSPTAELLARNMHFSLTSAGLDVESVTIYETEKNCATVRY